MKQAPLIVAAVSLLTVSSAYAQTGLASYYSGHGHGMTCAMRTKPMGSVVTVTAHGRSIRCVVNDRGPFVHGRIIDVSVSAARALGMMGAGVVPVSVD